MYQLRLEFFHYSDTIGAMPVIIDRRTQEAVNAIRELTPLQWMALWRHFQEFTKIDKQTRVKIDGFSRLRTILTILNFRDLASYLMDPPDGKSINILAALTTNDQVFELLMFFWRKNMIEVPQSPSIEPIIITWAKAASGGIQYGGSEEIYSMEEFFALLYKLHSTIGYEDIWHLTIKPKPSQQQGRIEYKEHGIPNSIITTVAEMLTA